MKGLLVLAFLLPLLEHANGEPFRIIYSGSSIACGTGVDDPGYHFTALLNSAIEQRLGRAVESLNLCYGGSFSALQLAALRQEGLERFTSDLVVVQISGLDQLDPKLASASIEGILRMLRARSMPALIIYPWTAYAPTSAKLVRQLAERYSYPLADMSTWGKRSGYKITDIAPDLVHPNELGHAMIRDAAMELFDKALQSGEGVLPAPRYKPAMEAIRFVPASELLGNESAAPLSRFRDLAGSAFDCTSGCSLHFRVKAAVLLAVFSYEKVPSSFSYRLDNRQRWTNQREVPPWLINHYLVRESSAKPREVAIRISEQGRPIALDGFLLLD